MKRCRTKQDLLDDPRTAKVGDPYIRSTSDILWQEDDDAFSSRPSWWLALAPGWRCDDCITLHEPSLAKLCAALQEAVYVGE